jgi:hypothetical protein
VKQGLVAERLHSPVQGERLDRITLGGICSCGPALYIMEAKLGRGNQISRSLIVLDNAPDDGRTRYPIEMRAAVYRLNPCSPDRP